MVTLLFYRGRSRQRRCSSPLLYTRRGQFAFRAGWGCIHVTERLYYHDAFLREFDAHVLACGPDGSRWRVTLDRTAFYPTSGGQPHDLGKLGDIPVVEVVDTEDGGVAHFTSAAIEPGPVHAKIDWPRRIDHMQQHTGQHLLSAVFIELFRIPTVSFHLGRDASSIDLAAPSLTPQQIDQAERRTNEIIFEDRVVSVTFGTAEALAAAGVRKQVDREGILRAVEIEGIDRQPCGGTHLARTGQAGLLLIRSAERRRDGWRLEFVCGYRALGAARSDHALLLRSASALSCGLPEVPAGIAKLAEGRKTQHSALRHADERLADFEARALLGSHTKFADAPENFARVFTAYLSEAQPAYLTQLASRIAALSAEGLAGSHAPSIFLLAGAAGSVVFAQIKGGGGNMGVLLRTAFQEFAGKGGGSKDFAQATLANPSQAQNFLDRAKSLAQSA